jgi:hypothetical protein
MISAYRGHKAFAKVCIMRSKINFPNRSNREDRHAQDKTRETQHQAGVGTWIENDVRTDPHNKQERKHSHKTNHRYFSKRILLAHRKNLSAKYISSVTFHEPLKFAR